MTWSHYVACFFGGAFLANAVPHFVAGVAGHALQTPFAKPPFRGLSSPLVNIAWALANLVLAYVLLVRVAALDLQNGPAAATCFAGFALMAFQCARVFARLRR
jgi:hypothetical protein